MSLPIQSRIKELLHYDEHTGAITRIVSVAGNAKAGRTAGYKASDGYIRIMVDGKNYMAHRLAWLYVNGSWPEEMIDHIDGVRSNNAISNLRNVDNSMNMQNLKAARKDNSTGVLGVEFLQNKYRAAIKIGGKKKHLGYFSTKELALGAYLSAKRKHHAGCTI